MWSELSEVKMLWLYLVEGEEQEGRKDYEVSVYYRLEHRWTVQ